MKSMLRTLATAMFGVVCYAGVALASPAVDFTGTTVDSNNDNFSLGWSFTANQNLYVNSLGVYAAPDFTTGERKFQTVLVNDVITEATHAVGIFDSNKNLIASTSVSNTDSLNGFFRYHALDTRLTLTSGSTYYIAAAMGADQYTWNTTGSSVNPLISYNGAFYASSNTLTFPAIADGTLTVAEGTFGPNMDVTPTPIPAAFWLLGSGLGMIGAVRRKNAKK
jgi:hypothetical protein